MEILKCNSIDKVFGKGDNQVAALKETTLSVYCGIRTIYDNCKLFRPHGILGRISDCTNFNICDSHCWICSTGVLYWWETTFAGCIF